MRPMIVVVLLLATGALGQGAYRPAPPVFVPSQDAPHTVGQPGHVRTTPELEMPRPSRVLPEDERTRKGPGLWAGDQPKASSGDDHDPASVDPKVADARAVRSTALGDEDCQKEIARAESRARAYTARQKLEPQSDECLTARLHLYCARRVYDSYLDGKIRDQPTGRWNKEKMKRHFEAANNYMKLVCYDWADTPEVHKLFEKIRKAFDATADLPHD
jgi:hypothetical protein